MSAPTSGLDLSKNKRDWCIRSKRPDIDLPPHATVFANHLNEDTKRQDFDKSDLEHGKILRLPTNLRVYCSL